MKKQSIKALSMSVVILTVVFATAVASANGQTTQRVSAQIPFDFVVGDKTLSAGEYVVSSATQDGAGLLIRKAKTNDAAIRMTHEIGARPKESQPRLVFHRYAQTYFLAEVWQGGKSTGRALTQSKAERALRRERASLAQNSYEKVELVASAR